MVLFFERRKKKNQILISIPLPETKLNVNKTNITNE